MLFGILIVGLVFWGAIGFGAMILPYAWVVIRDFATIDRLLLMVLFWGFEASIVISCFQLWSNYNEQSEWNLALWLLLPVFTFIVFLYAITLVEKLGRNSSDEQFKRQEQRRNQMRQRRRATKIKS